jgi:glycosyltransferase involved in cell wall biosynthesis
MRTLWLSHLVPFPPKGGVQQRSYNLIRELSKYDDVHVLAFNQRAHINDQDALDAAVRHFSTFCSMEPVCAIPSDAQVFGRERLAVRSLVSAYPYTVRWLMDTHYAAALASAVARIRPDAIHVDTISLAPYVQHLHTPAGLNHHNIESDMLLRRASLEGNPGRKFYFWQEGQRLRRFERSCAQRFQVHITCSGLDADRFKRIAGPVKTAVIPNGVDLDYFRRGAATSFKRNSMVFAGRLSWYPNAAAMRFFANEIWPLLQARVPDASVTIVGKSPPDELLRLASRDQRVAVTGFVDDVRPYLEQACVYICPIFDGGGTKLKIIDALAMGCAIVAHPVACEGIEVSDGLNVLLASTPEQFTAQVLRLFEDPELRARISANARALAEEKYSFVEIGKNLSRLYNELPHR